MEPIKCVVVGDGGAGKTCLILSYTTNSIPCEYVPGTETHSASIMMGGEAFNLSVCDAAKEEGVRHSNYAGADVVLLVHNIYQPSTFASLRAEWYPEALYYCPNAVFLVVGTHKDLYEDGPTLERLAAEKHVPTSYEAAVSFCKELHGYKALECSAVTQEGVKDVFDNVVRAVVEAKRGGDKARGSRGRQGCLVM